MKGRRTVKLNNVLRMAVAVLASALLIQLSTGILQKPKVRHFASWKNSPNSLQEAKQLAKHIVTGVVTKVEAGNPLVVRAPGEPGGVDSIPIEVATIKVEKTQKGAAMQEVRVFRTGSTKHPGLENRPAPPMDKAPPKPPGGVDRPAQLPRLSAAQTATIMLEDDPPYQMGQRYQLLLTDGPTVTVRGASVKTLALVSPEGRFHIRPDNRIEPVSVKAFAQQLKNMPAAQFEGLVKDLTPQPRLKDLTPQPQPGK